MPVLASKNNGHKLVITGPRVPNYEHIREVAEALAQVAGTAEGNRSQRRNGQRSRNKR